MNTRNDGIQNFLQVITKSQFLWRSTDIRVLAARINDSWYNVMTRCYLDSRVPSEVTRFPHLPVTEHIGCWQVVRPIESIRELIDNVREGTLAFDGTSVLYWTGPGQAGEAAPSHLASYYFSDLSAGARKSYSEWSAHCLILSGEQIHSLLQGIPIPLSELDNTIRLLEYPFDGIEGIAKVILGSSELLQSSRSATFEIFAPIAARFDVEKCRLDGGQVQFGVSAASDLATKECALGFIATSGQGTPNSGTIPLPQDEFSSGDSVYTFVGQHQTGGAQLTLFLRVGENIADRITLVDPSIATQNPRVTAYQVFDHNRDLFNSWLVKSDHRDADKFERAVARLLVFIGFQVDPIAGDNQLGDAVDILAYARPGSLVLAVECTTGSIGSGGKLGKLVARMGKIAQVLPDHEVLGVVATALRRAQISNSELDEAAHDRIAVLAQEELVELLSLVSNGNAVTRSIQLILTKVPYKASSLI